MTSRRGDLTTPFKAVRAEQPGAAPAEHSQSPRVALFPGRLLYNPYQTLLSRALKRRGVEVVNDPSALSPRWAVLARGRIDAVHLHWLEMLAFNSRRPHALFFDLARTLRVYLSLIVLRTLRVRVIWTVHNLKPHEPARPRLYRLLEKTIVRVADEVVVHSHYAARTVEREMRPRGPVHVLLHPSYLDWYPTSPGSRDELRERYGLAPRSFVFLLFGQVRPYKRVLEAVRSFRELDGDDLQLFVAGKASDQGARRELEALAAADPRVILCLRWIDDEDVEGIHRASDIVVLNHREVFSSGALLLAWSLGRAVVAPAGATTDELASRGPIERFARGELNEALARAREHWPSRDGRPNDEALAAARALDWDAMARVLARLYRRGTTR